MESENYERIPMDTQMPIPMPIQTFTPYYIDRYYQPPQFNNYFYYDGYMYPRRRNIFYPNIFTY